MKNNPNASDNDRVKSVLTFEDLQPFFLNKKIIGLEPPGRLHRLNFPGGRVYYRYTDTEELRMYWGGTTFAAVTMPDADREFLEKWMMEKFMNHQDFMIWLNNKADYGSFSHWQFGKLSRDKVLKTGEIDNDLLAFMVEKDIPIHVYYERWRERVRKDLLAFRQWIKDFNFRPVSVEFPIWNDELGVATQLDLIGYIDIPVKSNGEEYSRWPKDFSKVKNREKDVLVIVDAKLKPGTENRGKFHPHETHQLMTNRFMFNSWYAPNLGDRLRVDRVFNLSPSDWTSMPSYNFYEQTQNANRMFAKKWEAYKILWFADYPKLKQKFWIRFDQLSVDGDNDYQRIDLESAIRARHDRKKQPDLKKN